MRRRLVDVDGQGGLEDGEDCGAEDEVGEVDEVGHDGEEGGAGLGDWRRLVPRHQPCTGGGSRGRGSGNTGNTGGMISQTDSSLLMFTYRRYAGSIDGRLRAFSRNLDYTTGVCGGLGVRSGFGVGRGRGFRELCGGLGHHPILVKGGWVRTESPVDAWCMDGEALLFRR